MTDTLAVTQAISLAPGIQMTPTGAIISDDITLDEFCTGLQNCQTLANASMWAIGDLLAYGEMRGDWGEMYTQALDLTQKSYATLTSAVWMSKSYPIAERRDDLSWSHLRAAAPIKNTDERHALLQEAAREGWTREDVAQAVAPSPRPTKTTTCPKCGHEW